MHSPSHKGAAQGAPDFFAQSEAVVPLYSPRHHYHAMRAAMSLPTAVAELIPDLPGLHPGNFYRLLRDWQLSHPHPK